MDLIATQAYTIVESFFPRPLMCMLAACSGIWSEATLDLALVKTRQSPDAFLMTMLAHHSSFTGPSFTSALQVTKALFFL